MSYSVARIDSLVLGTVNASWKRSIDAEQLTATLKAGVEGDWLVHLATFFCEVRAGLIHDFAVAHGISTADLAASYALVRARTGERNLELEAVLGDIVSPYRAERGS